MQLKALFDDEQAVSPVIGVILMVAITVILAAVIGTFVLGLGDQVQNQSPQVSWEFNYDQSTDNVKVIHDGGDSFNPSNVEATGALSTSPVSASCSNPCTAGDTVIDAGYTTDGTIRIVWSNPDSDKTSVIGSSQTPAS